MTKNLKLSLFYFARFVGVFLLFRFVTRSRIRILCYHAGCLGDESGYNPKLFCSAQTFESRMRWLQKKGFSIVPLGDAVVNEERVRARSRLPTVITFDDGWHSTYSELIPVLGKLSMPSTLYLCTQHFLEGWPVPAVTVRYIIWKSARSSVDTESLDGTSGQHELRTAVGRERLAGRVAAWVAASAHTEAGICFALERFADLLGVSAAELNLKNRRFNYLSGDELRALPQLGCSVELHGHVHRYPLGDPAMLKRDLHLCSETIVRVGMPTPTHYCYPSGLFDSGASAALSELGVVSATTCVPGMVSDAADTEKAYFLPRFLDGESISMLEFEAELSGFSEFLRNAVGRSTRRA